MRKGGSEDFAQSRPAYVAAFPGFFLVDSARFRLLLVAISRIIGEKFRARLNVDCGLMHCAISYIYYIQCIWIFTRKQ